MSESRLVFPGDEIAVAEEFLPGPGTYEENGMVYAAWIGTARLDPNEFVASVAPHTTTPLTLKPDDIVIGRVRMMRTSFAIIDITRRADEPRRKIASSTNGTLHVSKIARDYLENIQDALRLGDIIRARVLEAVPAVQLSTKDPELGVIMARCPRCRAEMDARGFTLVCPTCDWKSRAKIAVDYGSGLIMPPGDVEARLVERDRAHDEIGDAPPSESGGGGRERGGRGGFRGGGRGDRGGGRGAGFRGGGRERGGGRGGFRGRERGGGGGGRGGGRGQGHRGRRD